MDKEFEQQYFSKEWRDLSGKIKSRDHNTCQMCGCNDKPMIVHHLYYEPNVTDVPDDALITLCSDCHQKQHNSRKELKNELDKLRFYLTDVEIRMILVDIYENISYDGRFEKRSLEPTKHLVHLARWHQDFKLWYNNLAKWRKRIRLQKYKEEAIQMFASGTTPIGVGYLGELKQWFNKTYKEDIENYTEKG